MTDAGRLPPVGFQQSAELARMRDVLEGVGYREAEICRLLKVKNSPAISETDLPLLLARTDEPTALATLVRVFLIGVSVEAEAFRRAIQPAEPHAWQRAGLIAVSDDRVAGEVRLLPFAGMWLLFDRPERIAAACPQYVMGVGSSSLTLANLTIRRPCRNALDLGAGCGIQAFLAAKHSEHVVAADRCPRAVQIAGFNAALNGLSNVEVVEGDLFEPVEGRRFDLVVSNPPFVISPESRFIYRDGGGKGDEICRTIVSQVPQYLEEGGFCQLLCNWAHLDGRDWRERLAAWFESSGCDAWVMPSETSPADEYASKWIRHTERDAPEAYHDRFRRWNAYYREQGIVAVSAGLITMRRRSGANWFRTDQAPPRMLGGAGASVLLGFQITDFLKGLPSDAALLDVPLRVSPQVRLVQELQPACDGWTQVESQLCLTRGLAYAGKSDPCIAGLVLRSSGRRALRELIARFAEELGVPLGELTAECLPVVRRLVEQGFLLPPGISDPEAELGPPEDHPPGP